MLSNLTSVLKDFHFAKAEIFLFFTVVAYVYKLAGMTKAIVAQKDGLLSLELAFELGARFVHGFVAFE